MKRSLLIILALLLCLFCFLSIAGCYNEEEEEDVPNGTKAPSSTAGPSSSADPSSAEPSSSADPSDGSDKESGSKDGNYPEEIHLESAKYIEGTGTEATYEFVAVLSPEAVKKGLDLGDVWARAGGIPTPDKWDGIMTYDGSGVEVSLENGGKRVTWRTKIYFVKPEEGELDLKQGTEVTVGVNAAGQDADGKWSEGPITNTITIKWQQ